MRKTVVLTSALAVIAISGCVNTSAPAHENAKLEQVLPLTLGGFLKDGPETEKIQGICETNDTRDLLNCDIYNGLPGWIISEVTLVVVNGGLSGWENDKARPFRVPVVIHPLTTEKVSVKLGLQLPMRWSWQNVGAKGHPAK